MKRISVIIALIFAAGLPLASGSTTSEASLGAENRVRALRVIVLSTMLADRGLGEWGFAALVEADGRRILFDTGARPDTVLKNARELGVDLSTVQEVFLSHNHGDHTSGLLTLRREFVGKNPAALSRVHVGRGIFWSRPAGAREGNPMIALKAAYEATGGAFVEHAEPKELFPGVWVTGPVSRVHPERNWSGAGRVKSPEGVVEDSLPEDMSMVFDTDKGLVALSGCGHAGIVNTLEYAQRKIRRAPVHAAIGGFHLFALSDEKLAWTAAKLREMGLRQFMGAHCTGIEAVFQLRQGIGLDRANCVVSAVGSSYSLEKGIDPLQVAR
ncbi:MAG: MBL fold metallo-hydrolase [Blastocatellia bacterium]|nr:MBL fold metallo-hydrolase [Blastocatellia bacterium]